MCHLSKDSLNYLPFKRAITFTHGSWFACQEKTQNVQLFHCLTFAKLHGVSFLCLWVFCVNHINMAGKQWPFSVCLPLTDFFPWVVRWLMSTSQEEWVCGDGPCASGVNSQDCSVGLPGCLLPIQCWGASQHYPREAGILYCAISSDGSVLPVLITLTSSPELSLDRQLLACNCCLASWYLCSALW